MTMSATEDAPAPVQAIPLNSLQALTAWRQHKEAGLRAPLSPTTQAAVQMCHAANMRAAMDEKAAYLEPLPKRDRGASMPYSRNPYAPLPVAETEPEPAPVLPPEQEAALERFQAAHDAEPEPGPLPGAEPQPGDDTDPAGETAVLDLDDAEDDA